MLFDRGRVAAATCAGGVGFASLSALRRGDRTLDAPVACDDLKFSVMLQAQTAGGWRTICLIDNAEGKGTHIHRYEGTRKLPAQPFHQGSAREGVPAARDFLREHARDILKAWRNDR